MRIAIASGKGGAGKTTLTASLAAVWDTPFVAVDTDVEAPNLCLFLRTGELRTQRVDLEIPVPVPDRCTACGACRSLCRYKALALFGSRLTVFPEMCHGCGGCFEVCPAGALRSGARELGVLEEGVLADGRGRFLMGRTRIGEAMTPPLLRALQARLERMLEAEAADALLDAPPGVSCPAMTVAREADLTLLAADPTPFGLYDFRLAHQALLSLGRPVAVVISRSGAEGNIRGDALVTDYCREHGLPLLAELPYERAAAEQYAAGLLLADLSPTWRERFEKLRDALRNCVRERIYA